MKRSASTSRPCQWKDGRCKREAQAVCLHCSKALCRGHFLPHSQSLDAQAREQFSVLVDKLNSIIADFHQLAPSPNVTTKPFADLDQWCNEAHRMIDELVSEQRERLNVKVKEYLENYTTEKEQQVQMISQAKKALLEALVNDDLSSWQHADLEETLSKAQIFMKSVETHRIELKTTKPNLFLTIQSHTTKSENSRDDLLRSFDVIYLRLDGMIRKYSVTALTNEHMSDLVGRFVQVYSAAEQYLLVQSNLIFPVDDHRPRQDYIFAVSVAKNRIVCHYQDNHSLSTISQKDTIIFYETSFSRKNTEKSRVLIPCVFDRNAIPNAFQYPIYLEVPQGLCIGQRIYEALLEKLRCFFVFTANNESTAFKARLIKHSETGSKHFVNLTDSLNNVFDFKTQNTSLEVSLHSTTSVLKRRNLLPLNQVYEELTLEKK